MPYYTYIATNSGKTVLYTGATNDLHRRIAEHANKVHAGFTARYNVNKIIWYEIFEDPYDAICAEKKIKGWVRQKKIDMIKSKNPRFEDLLSTDTAEGPSLCSG